MEVRLLRLSNEQRITLDDFHKNFPLSDTDIRIVYDTRAQGGTREHSSLSQGGARQVNVLIRILQVGSYARSSKIKMYVLWCYVRVRDRCNNMSIMF
jgi:hypothetical protein